MRYFFITGTASNASGVSSCNITLESEIFPSFKQMQIRLAFPKYAAHQVAVNSIFEFGNEQDYLDFISEK